MEAKSKHTARGWEFYFAFEEYPDLQMEGGIYRHYFETCFFTDITGLHAEIFAALTARKPNEIYFTAESEWTYTGKLSRSYIEELDYNHNPDLTVTQTRFMLANARNALRYSVTKFTQALALAQIDALTAHLERLNNKFNKP